jgi:DNA-directed RNA polymerase subunit L
MPNVDFRRSTVVVFFAAGGDNCDPYRVRHVIKQRRRITVRIAHVQRSDPNAGCTCASVIFEPYIIIQMPSTDLSVEFDVEKETHGCMNDV